MYAESEVVELVQRAVNEATSRLRDEYTKVLQERLNEQFRSFTKFNHDCVSRHMAANDEPSYIA